MKNEMTQQETYSVIKTMEELSKNAHRLESAGNKVVPADDIDKALNILRRVASGELVKAPIRCIDCEHSLPMDMKKYPDLTCHLCGGNLRVRVNMSCPCAKRPGKDDRHEANL